MFITIFLSLWVMLGVYIKELILALIASWIFYYIVVYKQKIREAETIKEFAKETYKTTKIQKIETILRYLNMEIPHQEIEKNYLNYEWLRKKINLTRAEGQIKNYNDPLQFKNMNIDILYNLNQLKSVLMQFYSYSFIRENKSVYEKTNHFIHFIDDFQHKFDIWYRDDNDLEFSKVTTGVIFDDLFGVSHHYGEKKNDDFMSAIEEAYREILISNQLKKKL